MARAASKELDLRSDWSVPLQATAREFPSVPTLTSAYRSGDHVQVWSNSRKLWLDGVVVAVYVTATVADGYSVSAGTVKVTSEAGVKWIIADLVDTQLRKVPHAVGAGGFSSAASGSSPHRSSGSGAGLGPVAGPVALCRSGCGRPVQTGFTRGLKSYDTCCKRCAQHSGTRGHDENCGQCRRLELGRGGGGSPVEHAHVTSKRLLDTMLSDQAKLAEFVQSVFKYVAKGTDSIDKQQVILGLQELMMMFGIKQDIHNDYIAEMCQLYRGDRSDDRLGLPEFLRLCQAVLEDRRKLWFPDILPVFTQNFVKKNNQGLQDVYTIGRKLGEGSYGVVHEVTHRVSGEVRVCKQIAKRSPGMDYKQILQEIHNMAMLDHPNVIKVYEYFEDEKFVTQIMEQCKGGELQDKVNEMRRGAPSYDEAFICDVMKQTLRALAFMHGIKFLHKDLKPQNIMLVENCFSSVKVIDFGLAELFKGSQEFAASIGGTLLYMAPEVFRQEMTTKVDVWSAGIILFNLLTGDFPFMETWPPPEGKDQKWWQDSTIQKIQKAGQPQHERLSNFSPLCVDLLCSMLRRDVSARPDAAQCLEHPWFQTYIEVPAALSVGVVQCVEAYARMSELKKAIFLLIAHQCALDAMPELRALFTHFDYRNRGTLSNSDLHHVLVESGMGGLRAERVLHALDRDSDGQITWTEFTAAAICVSVCRNGHCVDSAFAAIDWDHDGKATAEELITVFAGPESAKQQAWRRRMPEMFAELMREEGGQGKQAAQVSVGISRLVSAASALFASRGESVSRHQFRAYVGKNLAFRAGDALYAVS